MLPQYANWGDMIRNHNRKARKAKRLSRNHGDTPPVNWPFHPDSHAYGEWDTEKGLYMLATVLKSRQATEATFAIIETFANVRAMKRELLALHTEKDAQKRNSMMRHFGEALTDIVMPDLTTAKARRCSLKTPSWASCD